ncbi:hypothetical protein GTG23_06805 [Rhodococcus hoagii]|nr:hypothetical protein [Prescottella equi]
MQQSVTMPSGVVGKLSVFDRFATATSNFTSRAVFFVACVIIVVVWAPSDGAQTTTMMTHATKNTAREVKLLVAVANLSNTDSLPTTPDGMVTDCCMGTSTRIWWGTTQERPR